MTTSLLAKNYGIVLHLLAICMYALLSVRGNSLIVLSELTTDALSNVFGLFNMRAIG